MMLTFEKRRNGPGEENVDFNPLFKKNPTTTKNTKQNNTKTKQTEGNIS